MADGKEIDTKDLFVLLDDTVASARQRGFQKLREQQTEFLARSLQGGAVQAHRMANVDNALPALRLTIPIPLTEGGTRFDATPPRGCETPRSAMD